MHAGHRDRLRQRFLKHGAEGLEDHELLELLLYYAIPRQDVNPLAHRLLSSFGSLDALMNADVAALESVEGIGENSAILLKLLSCIPKRAREKGLTARKRLTTRESAGAYLQTLLAGRSTEAFYALFLDNQHRLIRAECIAEGNHSEAQVNPRELVQKALNHGAANVILGHNHPGGSIEPSADDILLTEKLRTMLDTLGIGCSEHFIIADDAVYAMGLRGRVEVDGSGPGDAAREPTGVLDAYALARMLKSLDVAQLDVVLQELD